MSRCVEGTGVAGKGGEQGCEGGKFQETLLNVVDFKSPVQRGKKGRDGGREETPKPGRTTSTSLAVYLFIYSLIFIFNYSYFYY